MEPPSKKAKDMDFMMALVHKPAQREDCDQIDEPFSPLGVAPFGTEHYPLAEEALERRRLVIRALLPKARVLAAELTAFNATGGIGPGEVELLGQLERWVLALQVEEDALRLLLDRDRSDEAK